ncbi:N-formylglutamate amidohydrolase [Roseobacter sp. N2S]|uniref:N-formylglutamate amidohydrolase n=1 Tax=Roseobacter sp. N2S TaxID=2663844 RepID=UPI0028604EA0|nr:N-formylglutamate amidohydrolase [Roseobacter sp. N2S]MDR6263670.1 putative N-formylglutamate amidohydrolase [Roseobacter sp. N2S]
MTYYPFVTTGENRGANVIVICDHAANTVPAEIADGDLGLPAADMDRHIAYDIGAAGVSNHLGMLLDAPVICSNFSRLVIDPNRGADDPTLLMRLYDGTLIPANRHADATDLEQRMALCHRPYHSELARLVAKKHRPVLISVHSFTPQLRGRPPRPWQIGILSNDDRRLSDPLLAELAQDTRFTTGDNVPYTGYLQGDTMDQHALQNGLLHTLIELRQDLIASVQGQQDWAEHLAPHLESAISKATTSKDI